MYDELLLYNSFAYGDDQMYVYQSDLNYYRLVDVPVNGVYTFERDAFIADFESANNISIQSILLTYPDGTQVVTKYSKMFIRNAFIPKNSTIRTTGKNSTVNSLRILGWWAIPVKSIMSVGGG